MSWAVSARKTSPVPVIFISVVPSPDMAFLSMRLIPPEPGVLEGDVTLVGDHRARLGLDRDLVEADLQQLRVLEGEGLLRLRLLELAKGALQGVSFSRSGPGEMYGVRLPSYAQRPCTGAPP